LYAAFGAMIGARSAHKTGKGQVIDAALVRRRIQLHGAHVPAFEKLGVVAMPPGSRLPGQHAQQSLSDSDHQYLHITAASDAVFRRSRNHRRARAATDARFATALARVEHEDRSTTS